MIPRRFKIRFEFLLQKKIGQTEEYNTALGPETQPREWWRKRGFYSINSIPLHYRGNISEQLPSELLFSLTVSLWS